MKIKLFAILFVLLTAATAGAVPTPTATATATATPVPTPVVYPHAWNGITDNQGHSATVVNGALAVTAASAGTGGVVPGNNDFFVNPSNIVPAGTGNIWFANSATGDDSNNCTSPASPCLTIQHINDSLAGDDTNDVVILADFKYQTHNYAENVTVTKNGLSILCAEGGRPNWNNQGCTIQPAVTGTPLTVNAQNVHVYGVDLEIQDDSVVVQIGNGVTQNFGNRFICDGCQFVCDGAVTACVKVTGGGVHNGESITIRNSLFDAGGTDGALQFTGDDAGFSALIENNQFYAGAGCDIIFSTATDASAQTIVGNHSLDVDKSCFYDLHNVSAPAPVVSGNSFATSTGIVTLAQIKTLAGNAIGQNDPPAPQGSTVPPTTNTLISSHITTAAAQNIFTASGDIDITDIALTTNSTGLAGGTNFVLSTDNTSGALTLCSNAVATLGASVSVKCSAAGVTTLKPFRLLSGKHILATCSVADCTGAGTITVTPIATRAAPYASFTNVALP